MHVALIQRAGCLRARVVTAPLERLGLACIVVNLYLSVGFLLVLELFISLRCLRLRLPVCVCVCVCVFAACVVFVR